MMEFQQTTKELNTFRELVLCAIVIQLEGFDLSRRGICNKTCAAFNLAPFGKGIFLGASAVGISFWNSFSLVQLWQVGSANFLLSANEAGNLSFMRTAINDRISSSEDAIAQS